MEERQGIAALVVGGDYFGFEVKRIQPLQKLDLTLVELVHKGTGAKMIHLANEDDNNLFGVAFPTTPKDSTGVAHILEHTALCGSKNFPVRDPFFSMIKRSMNTFMNAFTASDWTMYPFASQIPKDFYNLMDVYLDAAFFPSLTEMNFSQEGHRIEFETPGDPTSDLQYKGVVYNEMKGSMSQPSSILHRALGEALFPTLTYKNNSGGEPSDILNLSWDDLKKFHQTHYHPSNAFFYSYGNLPLLDHLEKIEGKVLAEFTAIKTDTAVGRETRYTAPQKREVTYPLSKEEDDGASNQFLVAWLTCDILEPLELLALQLINMVLLGSSSSPLRMA
ncbi:MAG: insulinase family protein, partial [SAR324 cluster bacterium]|nr:insulinase family protein [SAR324 cluster bacterium]